jgi:serine/threonine protein phosphatase 1
MNTAIRKLPANIQGKDYVVGDLHGCHSLLERLLKEVKFDKSRDRLFSVGDLIDRGPDSLRCLHLLQEPWFFASQGNHELMMLTFFLSYMTSGKLESLQDICDTGFLDYGGDWVKEYFDPDRHCMTAEFDRGLALALNMPMIWIVGDEGDRFHVIHAELVKHNYSPAEQIVWLDSDIDQWWEEQRIPAEAEDRLYWSRSLMLSQYVNYDAARIQTGLSPTFCGHTYDVRPRRALSHICLDTGAFISINPHPDRQPDYHGLTLFDVKDSCWVSASYQREELIWGDFFNLDGAIAS